MEAITKFAINSTLGTDDFKPLDKFITDGKSLISSNNVYYKIFLGELTVNGNDARKSITIPRKIKFNVSGSIKLKYYLYNATKFSYAVMDIYKNGELFISITGSDTKTIQETSFHINKKDEFYFVLKNTSTGGDNGTKLQDLFIYADVVDNSGITVEDI
jgi:hypothetical protein